MQVVLVARSRNEGSNRVSPQGRSGLSTDYWQHKLNAARWVRLGTRAFLVPVRKTKVIDEFPLLTPHPHKTFRPFVDLNVLDAMDIAQAKSPIATSQVVLNVISNKETPLYDYF